MKMVLVVILAMVGDDEPLVSFRLVAGLPGLLSSAEVIFRSLFFS